MIEQTVGSFLDDLDEADQAELLKYCNTNIPLIEKELENDGLTIVEHAAAKKRLASLKFAQEKLS